MKRKSKNNLFRIDLIFGLLMILSISCSVPKRLEKVAIMSVPWSITTRVPLKTSDLEKLSLLYKHIVTSRDSLDVLQSMIQKLQPANISSYIDVRILCVYNYNNNSCDTISIGRINSININGKPYIFNSVILKEIIKYLPNGHKEDIMVEYKNDLK